MVKMIHRVVIVLLVLAAALFLVSEIRISKLKDSEGPDIVMDQVSISVDIDCTEEDLLAGITAVDEKDGNVTDSLVVQDMSNFIEKGRRMVTVAAFDSDNNVTKASRAIVYKNYTSPRFSLEEPLRFSLNGSYIITSQFEVQDCLDGDLSQEVVITTDGSLNTNMAGEYLVHFQVSNSAGDVVDLPLTVEYYDAAEDNASPRVELSDYLIYVEAGEQIDPMDYVTGVTKGGSFWTMSEKGNPYSSDDIVITNPVDTSAPGVYEISYMIQTDELYQPKIRLIVIVE